MARAVRCSRPEKLAMYQHTIWIAALAIAGLPAAAQPSGVEDKYNGNAYGFISLGACNHGYGQVGGGAGAEALLWKGLTVGIDGNYQQFTDGWGYGTVTPEFGYHFVKRDGTGRWDPFFTMGAGWVMARGVGATANAGGGVIYWFKPRLGIRLEYRTHIIAADEAVNAFRVGISFR